MELIEPTLTEKPELESPGCQFCRLGKKNCCLGKNSGPSEAGRSYKTRPSEAGWRYKTGSSSPCSLRQLEGETPSRVLNMRVKWLGETKPAASAISVMFSSGGVQEHHSRRFPKRIMALHGRQPRFLIPEDSRNIAAENPPVIFRFGDAFSGEELSSANAGAVPVA